MLTVCVHVSSVLQVRFSALLMLVQLASKLKENYMVLLPESIPFLAELMEGKPRECIPESLFIYLTQMLVSILFNSSHIISTAPDLYVARLVSSLTVLNSLLNSGY